MKKFLLILTSIFLVSCASSKFESAFSPVYVTNSAKFTILPPSAMSGNLDGLQKMSAAFGKQSFDAEIFVVSDQEQLSMTILNEFGTTMASLFYDGASLDFESGVFPKNLKAEYIVADFQFCLYNAGELKSALEKIGVDFEESIFCPAEDRIGTVVTRTLSQKGKIISKITKNYAKSEQTGAGKSAGEKLHSIRYENFLRGYSYELTGVAE